ncbi:MAG: RT0821/Lpp0805 family surface protein [Alphaproteobacteria bacterium]|nr:RT0821/Lpp0805 family surface protein [Alphaproteobacteria bacterium]
MRFARVFLTPLLILAFVSACENTGDKEAIGTVLGAGVGAGLGAHAKGDAKVPTMILGALIGGYIGNRIGNELDEADRLKHRETTYEALEYGRSYETEGWRNPDNNTAGRVTPQPAFENDAGQPCREFQQTIMVGGREEQGYGTACRQEDGSWKIVSTQ